MKFIFDFDDVLLHTSVGAKTLRKHTCAILEEAGIPESEVIAYIEKERWNRFSIKKMLANFSLPSEFYEKIMSCVPELINFEIIEIVKKIGKENCFILTYGDEEFQLDKVKKSGIYNLFLRVISVGDSKKEAIEEICAKYKNEKVIFIDDKAKHFENLDFKKYPNLETLLYDEKGLEKLKTILPRS